MELERAVVELKSALLRMSEPSIRMEPYKPLFDRWTNGR